MSTKLFAQNASGTTAIKSAWVKHEPGPLSLQLINETGVTGTWKVQVSNKPAVADTDDAQASDITDGFAPVDDDEGSITDPSGSALYQYVQTSFLGAGSYQVVFTPSAGSTEVAAYAS